MSPIALASTSVIRQALGAFFEIRNGAPKAGLEPAHKAPEGIAVAPSTFAKHWSCKVLGLAGSRARLCCAPRALRRRLRASSQL